MFKNTFRIAVTIKTTIGVTESPMDLEIALPRLYSVVTGAPKNMIRRYIVAIRAVSGSKPISWQRYGAMITPTMPRMIETTTDTIMDVLKVVRIPFSSLAPLH